MDWKKSDYSKAQLEAQQRAYIKEALEMAKRSASAAVISEPVSKPEAEFAGKISTQEAMPVINETVPSAEETSTVVEEAEEAVATEEAVAAQETSVAVKEAAQDNEAMSETAEEAVESVSETDFIQKEELTYFVPEKEEAETLAPQRESVQRDVPLSLNQYISNHNRNQCNCRACQAKRSGK